MVNRKSDGQTASSINFSFKLSSDNSTEHFITYPNGKPEIVNDNFYSIAKDLSIPPATRIEQSISSTRAFHSELNSIKQAASGATVYKLDPLQFSKHSTIRPEYAFTKDGSNIISFIFNLNQNFRIQYQNLENDLKKCVPDIISVSTPVVAHSTEDSKDSEQKTKFALRFFDRYSNAFWADEVSEGVLYLLAILCVIHQPYPPKLLLLEEPEKGIHPRRIKEIMNFIFELARLRDIQIILTSHSPYVVDHFSDIPEYISVFDRENGETVVHNAADIIAETNAKLEAAGEEPIHYTDALDEYWVSGFLGGVPEVITGI